MPCSLCFCAAFVFSLHSVIWAQLLQLGAHNEVNFPTHTNLHSLLWACRYVCSQCGHESHVREHFSHLSLQLPLPGEQGSGQHHGPLMLQQLLAGYFKVWLLEFPPPFVQATTTWVCALNKAWCLARPCCRASIQPNCQMMRTQVDEVRSAAVINLFVPCCLFVGTAVANHVRVCFRVCFCGCSGRGGGQGL